jgi:NAD-dependent deacetylase
MKKIVVLSGAGMSAESGISTFRDQGGLWEQYPIEEVATPEAFKRNPEKVMNFYNLRRKQLFEVEPNQAHYAIAELEKEFDVHVITQNVDDLHERAGSSKVLHLHGELKKARSVLDENYIIELDHWELKLGMTCPKGGQLRPHIVWFGEMVPELMNAEPIVQSADILLIIGTSLNVYPAAGLVYNASPNIPIFIIDPHASEVTNSDRIIKIEKSASEGILEFIDAIKD